MGLVPKIFFWSSLKQQIPQGGSFLIDTVNIELLPKSIKQLPCLGVVRSIERLGKINPCFINILFIQLLRCCSFMSMGFHVNDALNGWQRIAIIQENLLNVCYFQVQ